MYRIDLSDYYKQEILLSRSLRSDDDEGKYHKMAHDISGRIVFEGESKEELLKWKSDSHGYKKHLAPILEGECKCCGWVCWEDSKCDFCINNKYVREGENCQFKKTCEEFWQSKENYRESTEENIQTFYSKPSNQPKNGFECSHYRKYSKTISREELENKVKELGVENGELKARVDKLETMMLQLLSLNEESQKAVILQSPKN